MITETVRPPRKGKVFVGAYVSKDVKATLERLAQAKGITVSDLLREMLERQKANS